MSQELTESSLYALLDGARGHSSEHNMQDFASLYHKYDPWLRRRARMLCGSWSDAEDLVSDVWLRVLERSPEWTSERVTYKLSWLLAVLHNRFWDQSRRRLRHSELDLAVLESEPAAAEPALDTRGEALLRLVDLLSPADRELLLADRRRSPGTALVDARTANLQRVRRHRLRRKLLQELSTLEPTEEADHEP